MLLVVGLLSVGNVATAKPPAEKAAPADTAKEAQNGQDAAAEKPKADAAKPEEPAAKAEPAAETKTTEAAKPAAEAKTNGEAKPAVHTVEADLVKVEITAKGVFEGKAMVPISVSPEEWKTLIVEKGAGHGAEVDKGDVLVQFETEKIDEAIADQTTSVRLAKLGLQQAEESLKSLEQTTPMDVAFMERVRREAEEDQKRYFEVDRPMSVRYAAFSLKSYEESLEYEQEELRQLEKMYKADDLTEETEEIILKRQRSAVERAEFYLEMAKLRNEETLKINMPRTDQTTRERTHRQDIASTAAKVTLPIALGQQQLQVERMKVDLARNEQRLKKLQQDREELTVRSPINGIVYYGKYVRGAWSGGTSTDDSMRAGGKISPDDVFMTVVEPQPLSARVTVSEGDLHWFRPGLKGRLKPTGYPDLDLDCSVTAVENVPLAGGSFGAELRVSADEESLLPGMTCTATFVPYLKQRALTVPAKSVFTDELDSRKQYVYLSADEDKPRKQYVTAGQKSGEDLEIVDGLVAGDKVLLEKPKDEK
jgi:hypothetical protein